MLFSMLMLIRKHPIMFLIGLYSPLTVVIGLVFYEPGIPVRDFVMCGIFLPVMCGIFLPAMFTFIIFMSCFIERGLDRKWLELGLRYAHEANGDGRDAHAVKAAKYFMKSALLFDDAAIVNLGLCYACGFGVEKDPRKAAKCYRVAAEKKKNDYEFCNGDRNMAQLALGLCYADGIGVERDKIKAEDLFCKAGPSFGLLQRIWNPEEVVMWLREAGKKENAFAQCKLGGYYWSKKDYAESVKWYRRAAEQGNAYAQTALGACYRDGIGVENDEVEAVKWYRKAADQGHASAQVSLGKCYCYGTGVEKNEVEAVGLFRKAAESGELVCEEAQILLASCYLSGTGVAKDEAEAIVWFRRVAQQDLLSYYEEIAKQYLKAIEDGDPEAQCRLARDYEYGFFFVENKTEAVKWYRKAAEQGNADAQTALGNCYCYGIGVGKDENEAVKWLDKAVAQGHAGARESLETIGANRGNNA